jgi:DNA-binding FadR family transcriptional regulator
MPLRWLVIERASSGELASLSQAARQHKKPPQTQTNAAEQVFRFHHEMAVLSGNTLLPLMYYSFRPESVHLWSIFCKQKARRGALRNQAQSL